MPKIIVLVLLAFLAAGNGALAWISQTGEGVSHTLWLLINVLLMSVCFYAVYQWAR